MDYRFPAIFPRDISNAIVQRNTNTHLRTGKIEVVDPSKGVCTISWLDRPGGRTDVLITQSTSGEWHMPEPNSVVIVGFDIKDQARILRYINVGQVIRVTDEKTLPKLKEGEKFWEVGGTYLYMNKRGDFVVSTLTQGQFILDATTGTAKFETINWQVITEGGYQYSGVVKRFIESASEVKQEVIQDDQGDTYTEYRIKVVEKADNEVGNPGLSDPLIDITMGTYVTDGGDVVNKNNEVTVPVNPDKALQFRLKLQSGVEIVIDKTGRVTMKNVKMNINQGSVDDNDGDIALGLEVNKIDDLGKRGQHVAREHDTVTIPIGPADTDQDHKGLASKASANLNALKLLATAIMSPSGPCSLNTALLIEGTKLEGEITEGADNIFIGDE